MVSNRTSILQLDDDFQVDWKKEKEEKWEMLGKSK